MIGLFACTVLTLLCSAQAISQDPPAEDLNHGGFMKAPSLIKVTKAFASTTQQSNIKTIVGCNDARNNNASRSGSYLSCIQLQDIARAIVNGTKSCYSTQNFMFEHEAGQAARCKVKDGDIYITSMGAAPSMRKKRAAQCALDKKLSGDKFTASTNKENGIGKCAAEAKVGNVKVIDGTLNSIYIEEEIGDYRVIATNGIPDHSYDQKSSNTPCEHYKVMIVKKNPTYKTDGTNCPFGKGPIGLSRSGSAFYDHLTDYPVCSTAYITNAATFGTCNGHANNQKEWHYHGPSTCLTGSHGPCETIGYMTDGFPLKSECPQRTSCYRYNTGGMIFNCTAHIVDENGQPATNDGKSWQPWPIFEGCDAQDFIWDKSTSGCSLDEANFSEEDQAYYLTTFFPFTIPKRRGEAGNLCVVQLE